MRSHSIQNWHYPNRLTSITTIPDRWGIAFNFIQYNSFVSGISVDNANFESQRCDLGSFECEANPSGTSGQLQCGEQWAQVSDFISFKILFMD